MSKKVFTILYGFHFTVAFVLIVLFSLIVLQQNGYECKSFEREMGKEEDGEIIKRRLSVIKENLNLRLKRMLNKTLIFAEEFDYTGGPDPNMWVEEEGGWGWGNNELQYYTSMGRNARVENGMLTIESRREEWPPSSNKTSNEKERRAYTSARIVSKRSFVYGIFEMRARLPEGRGSWPAFWLLSAKKPNNWPKDGEIDILEHVGYDPGRIHATIHCDKYNHMKHSAKNGNLVINDPFNTFHTYKLDWNAQRLVFYVDDIEIFQYKKEKESDTTTWPFDEPENIILNTAIGGNWGGAKGVDNSSFPLKYIIDYVRVYSNES